MVNTGLKLLGGLNAALGVSLLVGGPDRTSSDSFDTVLELVRGYIWIWGIAFLLVAAVCFVAKHVRWGAFMVGATAGVHTAWCTSFFVAAMNSPRASLTPIAVYVWIAIFHIVAAYILARDVPRK